MAALAWNLGFRSRVPFFLGKVISRSDLSTRSLPSHLPFFNCHTNFIALLPQSSIHHALPRSPHQQYVYQRSDRSGCAHYWGWLIDRTSSFGLKRLPFPAATTPRRPEVYPMLFLKCQNLLSTRGLYQATVMN